MRTKWRMPRDCGSKWARSGQKNERKTSLGRRQAQLSDSNEIKAATGSQLYSKIDEYEVWHYPGEVLRRCRGQSDTV